MRITMPRSCRFVYEISSNRGARHDPDEIDANQMDCGVVVANCSWIFAEMLRYSQKGAVDLDRARELVASITARKFPLIEKAGGRTYFHIPGISAREIGLLTLGESQTRMTRVQVIDSIQRHGKSMANAKTGMARLARVIDDDGNGNLKLLIPGIIEAETLHGLISSAIASKRSANPPFPFNNLPPPNPPYPR